MTTPFLPDDEILALGTEAVRRYPSSLGIGFVALLGSCIDVEGDAPVVHGLEAFFDQLFSNAAGVAVPSGSEGRSDSTVFLARAAAEMRACDLHQAGPSPRAVADAIIARARHRFDMSMFAKGFIDAFAIWRPRNAVMRFVQSRFARSPQSLKSSDLSDPARLAGLLRSQEDRRWRNQTAHEFVLSGIDSYVQRCAVLTDLQVAGIHTCVATLYKSLSEAGGLTGTPSP